MRTAEAVNRRGHAYLAECYALLNVMDQAQLEMSDILDGLRKVGFPK